MSASRQSCRLKEMEAGHNKSDAKIDCLLQSTLVGNTLKCSGYIDWTHFRSFLKCVLFILY